MVNFQALYITSANPIDFDEFEELKLNYVSHTKFWWRETC